MPREISSSSTRVNKVLIMFFYSLAFLSTLINHLSSVSLETFLPMFIVIILGFFIIRWALSWKKVEITDSGLKISEINFGKTKEIFVSFEDILEVRQNFFQRGSLETVIIESNKPTQFGKKIRFIPKMRFLNVTEHPIVRELNQLRTNKFLLWFPAFNIWWNDL